MGESLRQRMERERKLPLEDALRIARETADALDCAHRAGVIHRGIKPENILLSGGHPIVADFGVARAFDAFRGPRLTRPGEGALGIGAYMSPEQLRGDREPDSRTDVFSLGCVLYEMLTGTAAFGGRAGLARRFATPPRASAKRRDVPERVDDAVAKAMAKEPEERFHTVREFGRALSA
jgi:serine/threonine protein kinase